jgi:hypothetical protein
METAVTDAERHPVSYCFLGILFYFDMNDVAGK